MHPGTQPFNADPENARLADDYAIVMGSSHCEQMLRNNEGEWKAVNKQAQARGERGLGDFNYVTNRATMQAYWEERVQTNGRYENTYTLGLRGIHDYPMEGASTTAERVAVMQAAIDDPRDMLRRIVGRPLAEIPQVLCTYEEVLEAYHNGLRVPDDVTLLWSDDKHGYCRNLCNPAEMERSGGAGIYYHLPYHGDPASWIWLSPLSPTFLSTELTKAYTYGARRIWVFNVGDIKPAEKELSFVMDLAWDVSRWTPTEAHGYIRHWAAKTFGPELAQEIADIQAGYYQLQAGGKDAHVWFVDYTEDELGRRVARWRALAAHAADLAGRVPDRLRDAYFELVEYPVRGAAMLNEYQLLSRRSMARGAVGDSLGAMDDARRVAMLFGALGDWTRRYHEDIQAGKWAHFFDWQPYHWYRSDRIEQPVCTPQQAETARRGPASRWVEAGEALSAGGALIEADVAGEVPLWIRALTPIRNFSKAPADNVFCRVETDSASFDASATPINNVWHAHAVGPMWSRVGTVRLHPGTNRLALTGLKAGARIDQVYLGLWPPFAPEPRTSMAARDYQDASSGVCRVEGLGFTDGVMVLPFAEPARQSLSGASLVGLTSSESETSASQAGMTAHRAMSESSLVGGISAEALSDAPHVDYELVLQPGDSMIEVRTLPTLHVYEGRDARYAVQLGDAAPRVFSVHADDFSAEWRRNVLHGYASRSVGVPALTAPTRLRLRLYLLDPGVVLQEIRVYAARR